MPWTIIDVGILGAARLSAVKTEQQHTAKRIFERLRDEHGFTGGITIVKDYVAGWRQRDQEMFVPLVHPPGHAQADFGEPIGIIGGAQCKIHFFAFDLPHSDAWLVAAYPAETTEAFCEPHNTIGLSRLMKNDFGGCRPATMIQEPSPRRTIDSRQRSFGFDCCLGP